MKSEKIKHDAIKVSLIKANFTQNRQSQQFTVSQEMWKYLTIKTISQTKQQYSTVQRFG